MEESEVTVSIAPKDGVTEQHLAELAVALVRVLALVLSRDGAVSQDLAARHAATVLGPMLPSFEVKASKRKRGSAPRTPDAVAVGAEAILASFRK